VKAWLAPYNLLRIAAVGALVALLLMVAAFVLPGPVPLIVFMSAGQGLGTLSLLLYVAVVVIDLRRAGVLTPPSAKGEGEPEASRSSDE
jgi:hypothetical protein